MIKLGQTAQHVSIGVKYLKAEVSWVVKVWNSDKKLIYGENDLI
jgi:hypothetical protein